MGSKDKGELIEIAIQQLMEYDKIYKADNQGDHHHLLTRLLTQLETLKRGDGELSADPDEVPVLPSPATETDKVKRESEMDDDGGTDSNVITGEEIIKELKKVRRQNFITHCLVSVMIVLTLGWQLSQVSLILKVKQGFNHPFRSFGSMLQGMLKGPPKDGERESSTKKQEDDNFVLSPLKVPELPHVDLSGLVFTSDED